MSLEDFPEIPVGRLRSAAYIAEHVCSGLVNPRWVREHCPGVRLSVRKFVFFESEVRAWLRERQSDGR